MPAELLSQEAFRALAGLALKATKADNLFVALGDSSSGTTRFANSQVTQNVNTHERTIRVTAAYGQRVGSASTNDLSPDGIRTVVARAEEIAKLSPEDPEYLPPLEPQRYSPLPTLRYETGQAGPARLLADAGSAIRACKAEGMTAAGIASAGISADGLAATGGLFAYEQRGRANFSLTAALPDAAGQTSTGWVNNANRSIDDLGVAERTRIAIEKARLSASPREVPAGRYTVILEPAAVAGLLGMLTGALGAKSYYRGTSAVAGKLDQPIIDERLTLRNRPDHPSLLGEGFNRFGLPTDSKPWIERGVLKQLNYDRFTAQEHGVPPTYGLDAGHLSGDQPAGESVADLIAGTERGILVTNFWYIRSVNPMDLTITGMTRDGTFLIEDGKIAGGVLNFRFHDSPLRALSNVEAFTTPLDAITMERGKMLLPAMRMRDFNFSSVTKF